MLTRRVAVIGSRKFENYDQMKRILHETLLPDDELVSGGATGADSMVQRFAKEEGRVIHIYYPNWRLGRSAGFERNQRIVENSDLVIAFYARHHYREGGTSNTVATALRAELGVMEFEEEDEV